MTKADLIARLEKKGGSRFPTSFTDDLTRAIFGAEWTLDDWGLVNDAVNNGDLNAAIALCERVLPEWRIMIDKDNDRRPLWGARMKEGGETWQPIAHHAGNPATALCIALLRALEDGK